MINLHATLGQQLLDVAMSQSRNRRSHRTATVISPSRESEPPPMLHLDASAGTRQVIRSPTHPVEPSSANATEPAVYTAFEHGKYRLPPLPSCGFDRTFDEMQHQQ